MECPSPLWMILFLALLLVSVCVSCPSLAILCPVALKDYMLMQGAFRKKLHPIRQAVTVVVIVIVDFLLVVIGLG